MQQNVTNEALSGTKEDEGKGFDTMETIDTYIIRIYRRDENDPCKISGIVEFAGGEEKRTFRNRDELLESLAPAKRRKWKLESKKGSMP